MYGGWNEPERQIRWLVSTSIECILGVHSTYSREIEIFKAQQQKSKITCVDFLYFFGFFLKKSLKLFLLTFTPSVTSSASLSEFFSYAYIYYIVRNKFCC